MQPKDKTLSNLWTAAREDPDSDFNVRAGQLGRVVPDCWGKESWLLVLPTQLRKAAWEAAHTSPVSGHLGSKKTYQRLSAKFHWPGMGKDVKEWCKTCEPCQKGNPCHGLKAPLHPLPVVAQPWQQIAVDVVGELKRTKRGNRYILTVMDFASRWPEAIPLRKADAESTAPR